MEPIPHPHHKKPNQDLYQDTNMYQHLYCKIVKENQKKSIQVNQFLFPFIVNFLRTIWKYLKIRCLN